MTRLESLGSGGEVGRARWRLHLLPLELTIIERLPDEIETLLGDPASNRRVIERLFPPLAGSADDGAADRALLGDCLLDSRRELLAGFRALLAAADRADGGLRLELDAGGMDLVLRFANDVRMVLATDLGIDQNLDDSSSPPLGHPDAPKWALLEYLGGLEALIVDALSREM